MPKIFTAHMMREMTDPFAEKALIKNEEDKQKERRIVESLIDLALPRAREIVADNEIYIRASDLFDEYLSAEALLEEYLNCRPHEIVNVFGGNDPIKVIAVCQEIEKKKRIDSQKEK